MAVDERISLLRSRMQSIFKSGDFSLDYNCKTADKNIIPLSDPLSHVLPWGGLPRGVIVESTIAPLLAILFIAQVSGSGGRVGVVVGQILTMRVCWDTEVAMSGFLLFPSKNAPHYVLLQPLHTDAIL